MATTSVHIVNPDVDKYINLSSNEGNTNDLTKVRHPVLLPDEENSRNRVYEASELIDLLTKTDALAHHRNRRILPAVIDSQDTVEEKKNRYFETRRFLESHEIIPAGKESDKNEESVMKELERYSRPPPPQQPPPRPQQSAPSPPTAP